MPKKKLFHRQKAPSLELAKRMAEKSFLLLPDICLLSGVDEDMTLAMVKQFGMRPYLLETRSGETVSGYDTSKIKRMLAYRGRVIPGFNEDIASQRQWLEILEASVKKPLDRDWYFQPVNPDPLLVIEKEQASRLLAKIKQYVGYEEDDPAEVLRLIADTINVDTREDLPINPNPKWSGVGGGLFGRKTFNENR